MCARRALRVGGGKAHCGDRQTLHTAGLSSIEWYVHAQYEQGIQMGRAGDACGAFSVRRLRAARVELCSSGEASGRCSLGSPEAPEARPWLIWTALASIPRRCHSRALPSCVRRARLWNGATAKSVPSCPLSKKSAIYVTLRYVTLRYVTLRYVTLRYVMPTVMSVIGP